MKFHYLIVEGQTEQQFAEQVLYPIARARDIHIQVIVPKTGATSSGYARGGGAWKHMVGPIRNCLNNSGVDKVGVLFDVYGSEFAHNHHDLKGHALWRAVKTDAEASILNADDAAQRLVVGPVLYEFETLVIAALATGATQEKSAIVQRAQRAISQAGGDVELINGAPSTSPSHRISQWWSECLHQRYEKPLDGPRILRGVRWTDIESACPTFSHWAHEFLS